MDLFIIGQAALWSSFFMNMWFSYCAFKEYQRLTGLVSECDRLIVEMERCLVRNKNVI